jgi:hypothetical protein
LAPVLGQDFPEFCPTYRGLRNSQAERKLTLASTWRTFDIPINNPQMSSIIEGYNYDIFISYRQKNNKGDRWVSEFVDALKTELESTLKNQTIFTGKPVNFS